MSGGGEGPEPDSGKRLPRGFPRVGATLIIHNRVEGILNPVGDREQIKIFQADVFAFRRGAGQPAPESLPVIPPEQDQRKSRHTLGLDQGGNFKEFSVPNPPGMKMKAMLYLAKQTLREKK